MQELVEKYGSRLVKTALFKDYNDQELSDALSELKAYLKDYRKDEMILQSGGKVDRFGLVLEGAVNIENIDFLGERTILSNVGAGGLFAETFAFVKGEILPVNVVADTETRVMFFYTNGRDFSIPYGESWRQKIVANLLWISLQKNLMLSARSIHTAPKTIREKVMSYLSSISLKNGSQNFRIPFDRQELADYLCVDRTALSKELSRMQADGLISFRKNEFTLY